MAQKSITLKKREERRIADGHLWIFSNEIAEIVGEPAAGDVVKVRAHGGKPLGSGFYHPNSLIACRLLAGYEEAVDFDFFRRRIESALALRRKLFPSAETFRLVHGEGDYLSGLVVDKFNDFLSVQTFSAGMERRLTLVCDVLESLLKPAAIVERNESPLRALEGLEARRGVLRGTAAPTVVAEHGIKYAVDLLEGQKTGRFLDQRENRKAFRRYGKGAEVLDCFCNDGGFALNAAEAGAASVTGVDASEEALARARSNAATNRLEERVVFQASDVFEFLKAAASAGKRWDVINLDPPAFAKNRKSVPAAKRGYLNLNAAALRVLKPGGILVSSSCSHHVTEETFLGILTRAARESGRRARLLERRGASPDHPVHPSMPETEYLKFAVMAVD